MKARPLFLGFFLASLTPSLIYSQNQQFTNCHTLESSGNFVGSDETIVNGMVCKVVKAQEQQIAQPQPAPPASSGQSSATSGQPTEITNARVVEMSNLGLDDEIIIARIKHGTCHFQLGDADLVDLKKAGVSTKVIAAMLDLAPLTPAAPEATARPVDAAPAATESTAPSDGKVRVLVTDSQSWETRGGSSAGGNSNGWGGSSWMAGGARPQTAEIIKTLNVRCPQLTVTNNLGKADFVVTLDHEGGKGVLTHHNKIAVFNHEGDVIYSNSTRELGSAVKDACQAMLNSHR